MSRDKGSEPPAKSLLTPADTPRAGPPPWVATAVLLVVPATLAVATISSSADQPLVVAPWLVGLFVMTLLVASWTSTSSAKAMMAVFVLAATVAFSGAALLVALDKWSADTGDTFQSPEDVDSMVANGDAAGQRLVGAVLNGVDASEVNFDGADLRAVSAVGATFTGASFAGADLRGADLQGARMDDACLRGADLRGVQVEGVDLTGSDLSGALFDDSFSPVVNAHKTPDPSPCHQ